MNQWIRGHNCIYITVHEHNGDVSPENYKGFIQFTVLHDDGPKHVAVAGFYNITVTVMLLCAFVGLRCCN
jgi:hypothetical protein